ncbi:hypothetical protein AAKU67_001419 [Oxalobacteraceae bacterium GrIS 2.11]
MSGREEYIIKMKQQLDDLNIAIADFETRALLMQADAKASYNDNLFKLRQQLKLTHEKLDELKASSDNSWDQLVAETEKVRDAFVNSFHYFKSQI